MRSIFPKIVKPKARETAKRHWESKLLFSRIWDRLLGWQAHFQRRLLKTLCYRWVHQYNNESKTVIFQNNISIEIIIPCLFSSSIGNLSYTNRLQIAGGSSKIPIWRFLKNFMACVGTDTQKFIDLMETNIWGFRHRRYWYFWIRIRGD